MAEPGGERRLAAIIAIDVAGYSRLMGADEVGTLATLKAHRAVTDRISEKHGGRIVGTAGDGLLLEFPSVVAAVTFAVETQGVMAERNADIADDLQMLYRVGINLGDVLVDGEDIYGDGVNVAARIEALAEPGGICVSRTVRDNVRDKLDVAFDDMGEVEVKNITRPVRVFRVLREGETAAPAARPKPGLRIVAAAVALLIVAAGGGLWWWQSQPDFEPADPEKMAYTLPEKPSIAVLPFVNMSRDPDQEYFADGMSEDIITDLSQVSGLFVIARNSSFAYKDKQIDVRTIAHELGVRYVLEGSVRRAGDQVRINAQLIDTQTGGHLWAARYDGGLDNVFALQDKVTGSIVSALAVNLTARERAERARTETDNAEAYDAFLQGWAHYRRGTPNDFAKAVTYFETAIALDSDYSRSYAALAAIYSTVAEKNWSTGTSVWSLALGITLSEGLDRERKFLVESMRNPVLLTHQVASKRFARQGRHDASVAEAEQAVSQDPNDPLGHEAMSMALVYAGNPKKAEEHARLAMRLDPRYTDNYLFLLGLAEFGMERYEAAVATLTRAAEAIPEDDRSLIVLAAALGHLNKIDAAKTAFAMADKIRIEREIRVKTNANVRAGVDFLLVGPYTLKDVDFWPFKAATDRERLRDGLRLAGMPETGKGENVSPLVVDGATTVDPATAKALHDQGVTFVDVRAAKLWNDGHIPAAVNLALKTALTEESLLAAVAKDQPVVFYCMGPRCLLSSRACAKAVRWGFENVYYLREGYPAWKALGYPITIP